GDPVGARRLKLAPERRRPRAAVREPKAADAAASVAREQLEPVERVLAQLPEAAGAVDAERLPRPVVRHRTATQREAAVAAACTRGDLARFDEPHAHTALGERQRARAAGDAAADDDDLDRSAGIEDRRERPPLPGLGEPV